MNEESITKLLREIYAIQCRYQDCEDVFENRSITSEDTIPINDTEKLAKLRKLIQHIGEICKRTLPE